MYAGKIAQSEGPLISYVTVVLNGANDLRATIDSIIPHVCDEVEYIVVDGGSNDGTVSIIEQYEASISKWVSEKDTGIYDAMNKGIRLAKGDYICFINIGDRLLHCPLQQLRRAASQNAAAVSFPVELSNGRLFMPSCSLRLMLENTLHHQGTYYKRLEVQQFNLAYRIFADFDANQQLFKKKGKSSIIVDTSVVNAYHKVDGVSQSKKHFAEIFKIIRSNFGLPVVVLSYLFFRVNYGMLNRLRKHFK